MANNRSYHHFYTVEGLNGTIAPLGEAVVLENVEMIYSECVVINDGNGSFEVYVNTDDNPFILKKKESLEFEFTTTNLVLKNISTVDSSDYRVFLKRRVREFTSP